MMVYVSWNTEVKGHIKSCLDILQGLLADFISGPPFTNMNKLNPSLDK